MTGRSNQTYGPYVDIHCHLLPGLDDGPSTLEESLAMCGVASSDGTAVVCATPHQGGAYAHIEPDRIREATLALRSQLATRGMGLEIVPSAEVVLEPGLADLVARGRRLTVADRGRHLLVEFPPGFAGAAGAELSDLIALGITPILAHPERYTCLMPEGALAELVGLGCLAQVNASSLEKRTRTRSRVLTWLRAGLVQFIASDGHSPGRRAPALSPAFPVVAAAIGLGNALRLFHLNGMALIRGRPPLAPQLAPPQSWWTSLFQKLRLRSSPTPGRPDDDPQPDRHLLGRSRLSGHEDLGCR